MQEDLLAFSLFFLIATLYSTIGHAGASGYLAVMGLLSFAPEAIKPTSYMLNIVVAWIASVNFIHAGMFDRRIFFAFIMTSLPMAFAGGAITLEPQYYKLMAGIFLIVSALVLILQEFIRPRDTVRHMPLAVGLSLGGVIGLLSGLIGVGGGIFLSPILIITGWTTLRKASGTAALFILCNSIAGIAGHATSFPELDSNIFLWLVAVILGGLLGSYLGTKHFQRKMIITCLFLVLFTAGLKFLLI
jgi:uncharacterized membrane protein YfcA